MIGNLKGTRLKAIWRVLPRRFRLATVLLVMTLLAIVLATAAKWNESMRKEQFLVRQIEEFGGYYSHQRLEEYSSGTPYPPRWYRSLIGKGAYENVYHLTTAFPGPRVANDEFSRQLDVVVQLPAIYELRLASFHANGRSLAKLSDCRSLRRLTLTDAIVSDFNAFPKMPRLEKLRLGFRSNPIPTSLVRSIGDHCTQLQSLSVWSRAGFEGNGAWGLRNLRSLTWLRIEPYPFRKLDIDFPTTLRTLHLPGSVIDDIVSINKSIAPLGDLEDLSLADSKHLGDSDIANLRHRNLRRLLLRGTKVTGAPLPNLAAGLPNLRSLNLSFTSITDDDLPQLTRLKGLTSVSVVNTKVTDAGIRRMVEAFKEEHGTELEVNPLTNKLTPF